MKHSVQLTSIVLIALSLAWVNGVLLGTLQVVAWTNMFYEAKQTSTWQEALDLTFDPAARCSMCKFVSGEKTSLDDLKVSWTNQQIQLIIALARQEMPNRIVPPSFRKVMGKTIWNPVFLDKDPPVPRAV